MEATLLSVLLGAIVSILTKFADVSKVPTRLVLVVFSLAATILVKYWFHMEWSDLIASSWSTLGSAAGLYALLSKPAAKAVDTFFGTKRK